MERVEADWNENALKRARTYRDEMAMSEEAIHRQLTSEFDGSTEEEAQYALDNL